MKYLSFDVGIKNLAYCSLTDDKKILDWGIILEEPKNYELLTKEISQDYLLVFQFQNLLLRFHLLHKRCYLHFQK